MEINQIKVGEIYRTQKGCGRALAVDERSGMVRLLDLENDRSLLLNVSEVEEHLDAQYHCKNDVYY